MSASTVAFAASATPMELALQWRGPVMLGFVVLLAIVACVTAGYLLDGAVAILRGQGARQLVGTVLLTAVVVAVAVYLRQLGVEAVTGPIEGAPLLDDPVLLSDQALLLAIPIAGALSLVAAFLRTRRARMRARAIRMHPIRRA